MTRTFSGHRPISWTRQVKVLRPAGAGARGPEVPQRPLRRYSVCCMIRWRTRLAVLRRRATKSDKFSREQESTITTTTTIILTEHALPPSFSSAKSLPPSLSSFAAHATSLWLMARKVCPCKIDNIDSDENPGRDGLGLGRALTPFDFRCGRCPDGS